MWFGASDSCSRSDIAKLRFQHKALGWSAHWFVAGTEEHCPGFIVSINSCLQGIALPLVSF